MSDDNSFIIRSARIIDPGSGRDEIGDLAVREGKIVAIKDIEDQRGRILEHDFSGLAVCPGLIDIHVHLREPGQTEKEDIESGTMAAARGGFTTVVAMPNTRPVLDSVAGLADLQSRCRRRARVRVLPCPAITVSQAGGRLTDFAALKAAGAVALSEDGRSLADSRLMREAMIKAKECGLPIIDHCEDSVLAGKGIVHDGPAARRLGLPGKPRSSEDLMVARDIALAAETGCPVHIQHLSSSFSVELVAWARERGLPVSAEVTPHHLLLNEEAVFRHGSNALMNPPLREERDREALCRAVVSGVIEVIATDHAPHTPGEKRQALPVAPNGVIGLETALPVILTELYHRHRLPLLKVLSLFTVGPRRVLQLPQLTLEPGNPADITVFDPDESHTIEVEKMVSKSRNTPFAGMVCKGRVKTVLAAGKKIYPFKS